MSEESEEIRKSRNKKILAIIIVVVLILLVFITLGVFNKKDEVEEETIEPKLSDEESKKKILQEEKDQNLIRIVELEPKIESFQGKKKKIERKERRIFIAVRIIIAVGILTLNFFYFKNEKLKDIPSKITDLNGSILLAYSLFGYIAYGSINRFVNSIKSYTLNILRKRHIETLEELKTMEAELKWLLERNVEIDKILNS